jgi:signal peptidase II
MMSGRVVDMFYFPLFTWPEWMPLVGGEVFFGAVFNFADAAISCGAVAILIFYNKYISDKKEDTNATSDPSSTTNE